MGSRLVRLAAAVALSLVAVACSSSSGSGAPTSTSLAGTWCSMGAGSTFAGYVFGSGADGGTGGTCQFDIHLGTDATSPTPGEGQYCSETCTYTLSGDTLTLTATEQDDGGTVTTTCSYTVTLSTDGAIMEVKSDGTKAGCPSYDFTVQRNGSTSSCSFGC
jgi:hypothetical protein